MLGNVMPSFFTFFFFGNRYLSLLLNGKDTINFTTKNLLIDVPRDNK